MISFTAAIALACVAAPACAPPLPDGVSVRVVHAGLGLIDITAGRPGDPLGIEVDSDERFLLPGTGQPLRVQLSPDARVRIVDAAGDPGPWLDPFDGTAIEPAAEQTPAWALGAVWYNIFPERFDNANPANDQGWPHGTALPWTRDWFEVTADEFEASANRSIAARLRYRDNHDRSRPPLLDTVFERRFGGDLQGVERRLDHIRSLGATVIWFCPIFDATSLHKYDAADHRHIDPHLAHPGAPTNDRPAFDADPATWQWTEADRYFVDQFLPAAKSRGLRVVLDGVWNHVGLKHPTFQNVLSQGEDSPYASWYHFGVDERGRTNTWQAWDRRNGGLPEFRQVAGDLVPGPREYVFAATDRWMDPNGDGNPSDGIDGWRLDVANEVGLPFWGAWRRHVRDLNPQAALVGELWFDGREYFEGRAFDAQMNYPLAFAMTAWLDGRPGFSDDDFIEALDRVFSHAPATDLAQVNLLGSHDTARFASMMMNPGDDYDRGAGLGDAFFDRGRPDAEAFAKLELAYAVLTALPGSPMVYAGDELGEWGADDPENRKPIAWPGDADLAGRIGALLRLRQHPQLGPVLRLGAAAWRADNGLLYFNRSLNRHSVVLVANRTTEPLAIEPTGQTVEPLGYRIFHQADGERIEIDPASGAAR